MNTPENYRVPTFVEMTQKKRVAIKALPAKAGIRVWPPRRYCEDAVLIYSQLSLLIILNTHEPGTAKISAMYGKNFMQAKLFLMPALHDRCVIAWFFIEFRNPAAVQQGLMAC